MTTQAEISTESAVRAKLAEASTFSDIVTISHGHCGLTVSAHDLPADRYPVVGDYDQLIWIRPLAATSRGVTLTVWDVDGDMALTGMLDILLGVLRSGQESAS